MGLTGTGLALVAAGLGYAWVHPDAGRFAVGAAEALIEATWVGPGVTACTVAGIAAAARRSAAVAEALAAMTLPAVVAVSGGFALAAPGVLVWLEVRSP